MSDAVAAAAAPAVNPAKAKKVRKPTSKPKTGSAHPPVLDMVKAAVKASKDRKGTSLITIKKYIAANYKVDMIRINPFIRKALASGAEKGVFARVGGKGKGASGSFKIGEKAKTADKPKKEKVKKAKSPKKVKKPKVKKSASPKKAKVVKKTKSPKKAVTKKPKVKKSPVKKAKVVKKPATK